MEEAKRTQCKLAHIALIESTRMKSIYNIHAFRVARRHYRRYPMMARPRVWSCTLFLVVRANIFVFVCVHLIIRWAKFAATKLPKLQWRNWKWKIKWAAEKDGAGCRQIGGSGGGYGEPRGRLSGVKKGKRKCVERKVFDGSINRHFELLRPTKKNWFTNT